MWKAGGLKQWSETHLINDVFGSVEQQRVLQLGYSIIGHLGLQLLTGHLLHLKLKHIYCIISAFVSLKGQFHEQKLR